MSTPPTLAAPAKLNLTLSITGRRADGYHLLESLVAFTRLADRVTLSHAQDFSLSMTGPFAAALEAGADNLALRAAIAAKEAAGPRAGSAVRIELEKNIPVAAGLGGGSADAAAVLVGLAGLWGLAADDVLALAAPLGADVPVCVAARARVMTGIGDRLGPPLALPPVGLALVNPGVAVDTGRVFAAFDAAGPTERPAPELSLDPAPADARGLAAALAGAGNDLTAAACGVAPAITEVLEALEAADGCRLARMAGSGATCFGLFDDDAAAGAAMAEIAATHPGWWCWSGGLRDGR